MNCKRRFIPQLKLSEDSDQNDDARILRSLGRLPPGVRSVSTMSTHSQHPSLTLCTCVRVVETGRKTAKMSAEQ
jgi:hypothetical protein